MENHESQSKEIMELKKVKKALNEIESILRGFFDATGYMRGIVDVVSDNNVRHIEDNSGSAGMWLNGQI